MPKFKQVEHLSIIRTYYVDAKDETEAESLIENGDAKVKQEDETLKVFSCGEIIETFDGLDKSFHSEKYLNDPLGKDEVK